jgi:hypothetical protein
MVYFWLPVRDQTFATTQPSVDKSRVGLPLSQFQFTPSSTPGTIYTVTSRGTANRMIAFGLVAGRLAPRSRLSSV